MSVNESNVNYIVLIGTVVEAPVWSYQYRNEHFYITHILVKRISGAADILPLTIPGHLLIPPVSVAAGDRISVKGQLRSYNRPTNQGGKLMLTVYVRYF